MTAHPLPAHPSVTPSMPAEPPPLGSAPIPPGRRAEYVALVRFLLGYARPGDAEARHVAETIAAACLQEGHLWRAMRLPDRSALRGLFARHFPELERANDKDMRWKKFLYKRLCGWEGFAH